VELNATVLIQAVIILVLMAWMSPVLFGPLMKVFDERERRTHGAAADAEKYLGAADEKTAFVEQKTKEAQAKARTVLTSLREKAQEAERAQLAAAREKAATRLEEARAELFAASQDARAALKGDADAIANEIVKKVLGRAA
jgi:F-type H+-transporting ATPase subunit b